MIVEKQTVTRAVQPGDYLDSLLRTVRWCLKIGRSEQALALVISGSHAVAAADRVHAGIT